MDTEKKTIHIDHYYGSLAGMVKKFEKKGRRDRFTGSTAEEHEEWIRKSRETLKSLVGLDKMETCELNAQVLDRITVEDGIVREKVLLQVEPEVYMPVYILIPEGNAGKKTGTEERNTGNEVVGEDDRSEDREVCRKKRQCFIALPGHQSAGKYTVAGCREIPLIAEVLETHPNDYGMQLAKLGYVAVCPDPRGFGERRDEALQDDAPESFMRSTCFHLAHMAEGMGQTVVGMNAWDVMRLIDYLYERDDFDLETLGCIGFSGGGAQTLWAAVLDPRIRRVIISGYMYGYRDALLILNDNCSCNYVPHLWEHFDMGDLGAMIAPRPLLIQSCVDDHLNGPRGVVNTTEQVDVIRDAYALYGCEDRVKQDFRPGDHAWHGEFLAENLGNGTWK